MLKGAALKRKEHRVEQTRITHTWQSYVCARDHSASSSTNMFGILWYKN